MALRLTQQQCSHAIGLAFWGIFKVDSYFIALLQERKADGRLQHFFHFGIGTIMLELRPASLSDLDLLSCWDEQPHVMASDPNDDWQWEVELGRKPSWRAQLIAEFDGRPIGFIQIIDPALEETHYWGACGDGLRAIDIWLGDAADLGRGYGTAMMRLALARCFSDAQVTAVLVDPLFGNAGARRFYERLGFGFVEQRRFGDDECAVYQLSRKTWEKLDTSP